MAAHVETTNSTMSWLTYAISVVLTFFSDTLSFLNENAQACGVILGLLTFITNFFFRWREHKQMIVGRKK
jgi:hypothetical protein